MAAKKNDFASAAASQFDHLFSDNESDKDTSQTQDNTSGIGQEPDENPIKVNQRAKASTKRKPTRYRSTPQLATESKSERLQMLLEKSTKKRLSRAARSKKMSMNEYALEAIKAQLDKDGQ